MKRIFVPGAFILFAATLHAQNVGIDVPVPQQKLDVNGAIKIGTTATNQPGSIRFNAGKFEGGDGTNWKVFEGTTSGIVGTKLYNNPALLNAGYSLFGEIPGIASYSTTNTTFLANSWQPTYTRGIVTNVSAPAPKPTTQHPNIAVWNGSLMYVATATNLYTYNPVTDIWNIVNNQGFSGSFGKAIWSGSEIIFWSGTGGNGSRYNPATNSWAIMSVTNIPSQRYDYTMIWDGSRVIVWGGEYSGTSLNTGAMYNPATDTWTAMSTAGAPSARTLHTAVWNNVTNRMIIWGGSPTTAGVAVNTGALFNPAANTWTGSTNSVGAPSIRRRHTAVWTGTEMIIFGGAFNAVDNSINTGGKYNPSTDTWIATSISGTPYTYNHAAVWTGTAMIVSGGSNSTNSLTGAYSYNPITNLWTNSGQFNTTQDAKENHYSFLAGNILIVYGGLNNKDNLTQQATIHSDTGYRYFLANTASSATTLTNETLYLYQKN